MIHHNFCNAKRRKYAVTFSIVKLHLVALRLSDYLSKTHFARDFLQKWKWDSSKVTLLQGRQILRLLRTSDTPMSPKTAPVPKTDAPTISPDTAPVMKNDSPPSPNLSATSSFLFFSPLCLAIIFSLCHSFFLSLLSVFFCCDSFCDPCVLWVFLSVTSSFCVFFLPVILFFCHSFFLWLFPPAPFLSAMSLSATFFWVILSYSFFCYFLWLFRFVTISLCCRFFSPLCLSIKLIDTFSFCHSFFLFLFLLVLILICVIRKFLDSPSFDNPSHVLKQKDGIGHSRPMQSRRSRCCEGLS